MVTPHVKVLRRMKKYLCLLKALMIRNYYKLICETLLNTSKEIRRYYCTQITTSENKTRTTWKSINGKKTTHEIRSLCADGKVVNNFNISKTFDDEFLSTAGKVNNNSTSIINLDVSLHMDYLLQNFKNPSPNIKVKYTPKKSEKKKIKSLKPSNSHGYDEICTKNHKS